MNDLTADTVAIGERDGQVCLEFQKPIKWAVFDPETARQIGMAIAKESYDLHVGKETDAMPAKIMKAEIEEKLLNRMTIVIKNMTNRGIKPGFIAKEILNIVMREVS